MAGMHSCCWWGHLPPGACQHSSPSNLSMPKQGLMASCWLQPGAVPACHASVRALPCVRLAQGFLPLWNLASRGLLFCTTTDCWKRRLTGQLVCTTGPFICWAAFVLHIFLFLWLSCRFLQQCCQLQKITPVQIWSALDGWERFVDCLVKFYVCDVPSAGALYVPGSKLTFGPICFSVSRG